MTSIEQQHRIARRLKALRGQAGLTQAELSDRLGFNDRQTLAAIEAGERRVSPDELVRAAAVLGTEVDAFLDPFRLIGEGAFSFRAREADERTVADFEAQARRWIATYRELGMQAGAAPRRLGAKLELTPWSSFEDAAASAEWLWAQWELGEVPAERLQEAMEQRLGALVLYVDAPGGISGAASQLPGLNTVLINRREPRGRRSFDLAHELFHLLTWDAMPPRRVESPEVKPAKGNRVEQLAENFAAALLMPAPLVQARWAARGAEEMLLWMNRTASDFRVSVPALQWRLVNLGLLAKGAVPALGAVPRNGAAREDVSLLFSAPFIQRISVAVEEGRLSLRRAAALLDLELAELADLCAAHGHPLSYELPR